jgi:hypothetical protein
MFRHTGDDGLVKNTDAKVSGFQPVLGWLCTDFWAFIIGFYDG